MKTFFKTGLIFGLLISITVLATEDKKVFFVSPKAGSTVAQKFKVQFGVAGMKIRPAGEDVNDKFSGHHHLLIDVEPAKAGEVVTADDKHIHFGKGQTEAEVSLPPGKHKLTLQFADGAHKAYGPQMTSTIEVTVK